ncbi:hypothetical protein [Cupriavidus oxalaticus]|uniref:Uncharacterized protein n=1 Tax=Cupriavidus oxalaticus TaxID=96344 RepID=A0A4P7LH80_9BURK|nr:hypothetical protein [Cupriavidus oxalaticus]QBY55490.1 hypothetical protein E0W60_31180 [Cupriavidus oxalaticus]
MQKRVYTEEEVQDLTDRVFLLQERIERGKMHVAEHLVEGFTRSMRAIRLRPDGKVDPETVDGHVRATTLAIRAMQYRDDAKSSVSLAQIQEIYFDFLFKEFGWLFDQMQAEKVDPAQVAHAISEDSDFVKGLTESLPGFVDALREFWGSVFDPASFHLQDGTQLKAAFSGDLFPAHWENTVSTAGLYIDTIILPCPIMRIAPIVGIASDREIATALVKHMLTAMTYREIATAELDPPVALVLPNRDDIHIDDRQIIVTRATPSALKHAEYLFHRQFESVEHLQEFCGRLQTIDHVIAELKGQDRLVFDTDWGQTAREQLDHAVAEQTALLPGMDRGVVGHHVLQSCVGRMAQAMGAQQNAIYFGGTPLINASTSWKYYTWLLDYQGAQEKAPGKEQARSMHVVHALAHERDNNLSWLGNVPVQAVLEIRKNGLMDEVRSLLGSGVSELIKANPNNYFRTADQVVSNLERAFAKHQTDLLEARNKKLKLFGLDVPACLAVGALGIAAATITDNPVYGVVGAMLGQIGLPNLKDIKSRFTEIRAEEKVRAASPTGLLFQHVGKRR